MLQADLDKQNNNESIGWKDICSIKYQSKTYILYHMVILNTVWYGGDSKYVSNEIIFHCLGKNKYITSNLELRYQ